MPDIFKQVIISEDIAYIGTPPANAITNDNAGLRACLPTECRLGLDPTDQLVNTTINSPFIGPLPDGLAQERAHLHEQTNTLSALLHSIPKAISDNRQQLSSDIADIVLLITSKFFINQQQNKNAIADQISQILTQLNEKQNLVVSLHPQDLELIQQGEVTIDLRSCKHVRLKADVKLRLGGCIITSEHGVFDAGIERQIDNLKHVLMQMKSKHE